MTDDLEATAATVLPSSQRDLTGTPYPAYVVGAPARERWNLAWAICAELSAALEPDGVPDFRFCWVGCRALFFSDEPTGPRDPATPERLRELAERLRQ
jgi:hypothetical protein